MPPPSPQKIYFEGVFFVPNPPPAKAPLPAWFAIVLAIAIFWVGVQCIREIDRRRSQ